MVKIRRAYEGLFLGLFLFFLLITDLRYLKGWPVSLFLEATPLVAVATALTTHTIYRNLVWGLVIIAITMMLGRVWCNWMCPFGILHHIFGIIGNRRNTKQMIEVNRYRKIYAIKYYILAAMIAMAGLWIIPTTIDAPGKIWQVYHGAELKQSGLSRVFAAVGSGIAQSADEHKLGNSSLQIGLLDPIALTVRSMTTSVLPTVDKATESVYTEPREYWQAWIVGLIFIGFLFANWWIPRFFCRAICPLGALLGLFSRFALWRIDRDPVRCTDCDLCLKSCEGRLRPAGRPPQERVLRLPQLHRGLPPRRPLVPVPAAQGQRGRLSGRRPPRAAAGRTLRPFLLPDDAALRRREEELQPQRDPAARLGRRGRVPAPLHQVRPVHPGLPNERSSAGHVRDGARGSLDADHDLQDGLVRAQLHAVQPGLPHRRHPRDLDRREAGRSARSRARDRSRRARPFTIKDAACPGRWTQVASSARRSARSAPRPSSPATSRSPTAGVQLSSSNARSSTQSSASAAVSASTSVPSRTTLPSTSPPSVNPATRAARSCCLWSTARGRTGCRSERVQDCGLTHKKVKTVNRKPIENAVTPP